MNNKYRMDYLRTKMRLQKLTSIIDAIENGYLLSEEQEKAIDRLSCDFLLLKRNNTTGISIEETEHWERWGINKNDIAQNDNIKKTVKKSSLKIRKMILYDR